MGTRWSTVLAVLVVLNSVLVTFALVRLRETAMDGAQARVTQCRREPVLSKLVAAGVKYRLLTRDDLRAFVRTKPTECPPRSVR